MPAPRRRAPGEPLRIAFVGQAVERKGLPVLLRAFEALRREVPAELIVIGSTAEELAPLLVDGEGVTALGRIDDAAKERALRSADLLCAPSLGGESFGMVLTEAFAAGTPVVASDIAGYRDVVAHGRDGLLVPRADATALAETLRDLALDPARVEALAAQRRRRAPSATRGRGSPRRSSPPTRTRSVVPQPETRGRARGDQDRPAARRRPGADPGAAAAVAGAAAGRRPRAGASCGAGCSAAPGWRRSSAPTSPSSTSGWSGSGTRSCAPQPSWVLLGLALMCASMLLRAVSWHAILKAAMPDARPRMVDAVQGTTIGVLMSATLPARLGEPSRALVVARRLGRARDRLPVVLGTLVSQTLINVLALVILGAVMFTTIGLFAGRQQALLWYGLAPLIRARARARRAGADPQRAAVALGAGGEVGRAGARRRLARALGPDRLLAPARGLDRDLDAAVGLGAAVGVLLRAAGRARASSTRPTSARRPRSCSRST